MSSREGFDDWMRAEWAEAQARAKEDAEEDERREASARARAAGGNGANGSGATGNGGNGPSGPEAGAAGAAGAQGSASGTSGSTPPPPGIHAQVFRWRDPRTFPRRQWVYGRHLIRRFLSATVAPGGAGKSSLALVDAIAMATGRALVGNQTGGPLRVWYWNLEDPLEEIERRILAVCIHYGIGEADLGGRLFVNSGRDTPLVIAASDRHGLHIAVPLIHALRDEITAKAVDVVMVDPFVACHRVTENDNNLIGAVAQLWGRIADQTNTGLELWHHTRKSQFGQNETTVEDGRGAGALLAAVRSARVLNVMSREEAERFGVAAEERRTFFRTDNGKANLVRPSDNAVWHRLVSVDLGNGTGFGFNETADLIGVVTPWTPPDPLAGVTVAGLRAAQAAVREGGPWRESPQAAAWVGRPIAEALGLNVENEADRRKVVFLLKTWIANRMFVVVLRQDETRRLRKFVEVGNPAND